MPLDLKCERIKLCVVIGCLGEGGGGEREKIVCTSTLYNLSSPLYSDDGSKSNFVLC